MASRVKKSASPPPAPRGPGRFYAAIGLLAVAGAVVLFLLARGRGDVSIPANVTVLEADTAGFRGYVLGSESAPIEITEYADYQCPACQDFAVVQWPAVRRTLIETGLARWRFRDFPLDQIHRHARLAAHSAACANDQGRFWEQQDQIFETHPQWSVATNAGSHFRAAAERVGLDLAAYDECMASAKYAGRIEASLQEGIRLGVNSTPTFLVGGRLYPGRLSSDSLAALVRNLTGAGAAR
jgi:protein-disulfide isomerase